jgi:hypothetical protein
VETPYRRERPARTALTMDLPSKILGKRFPIPADGDREISLPRADRSGGLETWIG